VSAVSVVNGGDLGSFGVEMWRCSRQDIAARPFFMAGIVCEEVLEQPRRCFACRGLWLVGMSTKLMETVPGAIAAIWIYLCTDQKQRDVSEATERRKVPI
jgi:hypothetical protein